MKGRMNTGIDLDEVVVEFLDGYLEKYKNVYGGNIPPRESIGSCNFWDWLPISKEESLNLLHFFHESSSFENLDLVNGARDSVLKISKNHDVYFITSRPQKLRERTQNFLQKHFPGMNYELHFSGDFGGKEKNKGEICRDLKIDVMIEDNLEFALGCCQNGTSVLLYDKPWNRSNGLPKEITRVKNWNEILENLM